ncbi:hypothetical protein HDV03_002729 [Kappamyces sp. JEL0829]|nr:hypothetical protein HDV03_002729 [Kappamyces sp. JEL0829]
MSLLLRPEQERFRGGSPCLLNLYEFPTALGFDDMEKYQACLEMMLQMRQDALDLGLELSPTMNTVHLFCCYLTRDYTAMEQIYLEACQGSGLTTFGFNLLLEHYCSIQFDPSYPYNPDSRSVVAEAQPETASGTEPPSRPPFLTKRRLWKVVSDMNKAQQLPDMGTFEYLLVLFARGLNDPKAVHSLFNKISASRLPFSQLTFVVYVDSLARIAGEAKRLNKIMHRYRMDPSSAALGSFEPMAQALIRYWLYQGNPNPCFKILAQCKKHRLLLGRETVALLLDAGYVHSNEEPLAALEVIEPYLRELGCSDRSVWRTVLHHYGRYLPSKAGANALVSCFRAHPVSDQSVYSVLAAACGVLRDVSLMKELVPLATDDSSRLALTKAFMNGWLDGQGSSQDLQDQIKIILGTESKSGTNTGVIIGLAIAGGAVVFAAVGIFIFRKFGTKPSDQFKNRLRQSFTPASHHHDAGYSRPGNAGGAATGSSTPPAVPPKAAQQFATYETVETTPVNPTAAYQGNGYAQPTYGNQGYGQSAYYASQQAYYVAPTPAGNGSSQVSYNGPAQYYAYQPQSTTGYQPAYAPAPAAKETDGLSSRSGSNAGVETNAQGVPKLF